MRSEIHGHSLDEVSHVEQDLDFMNRVTSFRDQRYHATNMDTEVFYHYDSASRTVRFLDAANTLTASEFDLISRTTRVTRSPGAADQDVVTDYEYDADSRNTLRRIWSNPGAWTQSQDTVYQYDERNRLKKLIRPSSEEWTFSYNAQNRTGWTDPLGTTVSDTYDDRNLVTERNISRGTGVLGVTKEIYEYDGLGRLTKGANYEEISSQDELHVDTRWEYNTLSLPEKHYQEMEDWWGKSHSSNTFATYDATGFNTGHTYASGLELTYARDGLNRVNQITAASSPFIGKQLAEFWYAGNRLVKREFGNGTIATVAYEASGCGCGGFSGFVESVMHENAFGTTLYREERRFDVTGNVTALRWEHLGNFGEVYRQDDTYRLTDVYEGVGLQGGALNTYANTANTPTAFSLHREYAFDTRGNRTGVTMTDDGSTTIKSDSYSPDADTNVYNSVDGQSFLYDDVEQMTYDPTTGLYNAYDYMGRLIVESTSEEFASPERRYRYDVHSRLRVEEVNYDNGEHLNAWSNFSGMFPNDPGAGSSGCGGGASGTIFAYQARMLVNTENVDSMREYVVAQGVKDGMSANVGNPWAASRLPGGSVIGKVVNIELATRTEGPEYQWLYRHENQQRSLRGVTDDEGFRKAEIDYSEYGVAFVKKIIWDGGAGEYIDTVAQSTDPEDQTIVTLLPLVELAQPVTAEMLGALARVVMSSAPYVLFGRVTDVNVGAQEFSIEDPSGDIYAALTANPAGVLTVFDHHDANIDSGAVHTAGVWEEESIEWKSGSGWTEFTSGSSLFPAYANGWFLQPDASVPTFFPIIAASASTLTVAGNLEGVASEGGYYFIIPPAGVDKTTGALSTDPKDPTSRYLAFGYYYMPPVAGIDIETTTFGSQPGINLAGHYYCHHRRYDPVIGRWTTPDPAAMWHWWNLLDYLGGDSARQTDPNGMYAAPVVPLAAKAAATAAAATASSGVGVPIAVGIIAVVGIVAVGYFVYQAVNATPQPVPAPLPAPSPRRAPPKPSPRNGLTSPCELYRYYSAQWSGPMSITGLTHVTTNGTHSRSDAQEYLALPPDNPADMIATIKCEDCSKFILRMVAPVTYEQHADGMWIPNPNPSFMSTLPQVSRTGGGTEIVLTAFDFVGNCVVDSTHPNSNP